MSGQITTIRHFSELPLGTRFRYTHDGEIFVKIDTNIVTHYVAPTNNIGALQGIYSGETAQDLAGLKVIVSASEDIDTL